MKVLVLAVLAVSLAASAQTSYPPAPPGRGATPAPSASTPAAAPIPLDLNQLLSHLDQTTSNINASLSRLRIEKWKTDGQAKGHYQSDADSISRNITSALPEITGGVRNAPAGLAANFKLYRNVGALYDVFASLTEAAGAFGPKEDYQALAQELQQVDDLRRAFGDRVSDLAASADAQMARLKAQAQQQAQAQPPKKIIVDNGDESPKPKKKKKPAGSTAQTQSQPPQQ
jgi:hypothetical protein